MTRIPDRTVVVDAGPMKVFSLLTADPNPIHWDAERPVNQGGLNVGYVIGAVSEWAGSSAAIRGITVRFLGAVLAGDRVTAGGEVEEVRDGLAHLRVWLRGEDGTDLLTGTATVETGAVADRAHAATGEIDTIVVGRGQNHHHVDLTRAATTDTEPR